jgi:hypothetical protein
MRKRKAVQIRLSIAGARAVGKGRAIKYDKAEIPLPQAFTASDEGRQGLVMISRVEF